MRCTSHLQRNVKQIKPWKKIKGNRKSENKVSDDDGIDPEELLPVTLTWELGKMEGKELLGLAHLIFFYRFFFNYTSLF